MSITTSQELPAAAIAAIHNGDMIEAIKIARGERVVGLKEAKDLVDSYIRSRPEVRVKMEEAQARSRRGLLRWLILLSAAAATAAYWIQRG